jgi:hypothetical protein
MRGIKHRTELPPPSFSFLNNFRTTLQSLHLDFDAHIALGPTIGSFKRFTNLKDLFITTNPIYDRVGDGALGLRFLTDILPNNLEKLTLQDCPSEATKLDLATGLEILAVSMHTGLFPQLVDVLMQTPERDLRFKIYRENGKSKVEAATESGERTTIDLTPN